VAWRVTAAPPRTGGATATYAVECYWPDMSEALAKSALRRIASASAAGGRVDAVLPLGCILMPTDGLALFLFSVAVEASRTVSRDAELPFDRIVESVPIFLPFAEPAGR
jgi:hypothetical protein